MNPTSGPTFASAELQRGRIGAIPLSGFLLAALTPMVIVVGVIPVAYASSGLKAIPVAFAVMTVVLAIFLFAYLAMARYVRAPGAFYAYISLGLGRPAGTAAAMVAAVAYCELQVGLYFLFGPTMHDLMASTINLPWQVWGLGAVLAVAILGVLRLDVAAWLLVVLVALEIITIVGLTVRGYSHPAGENSGSFNPALLVNPALLLVGGATAAFGPVVLSFVGVEQAATYAGRVKEPVRRTMLIASLGVLLLGGILYMAASGAIQAFYGDSLVATATDPNAGPNMVFALGGNGLFVKLAHIQLPLSLGAAALAFHNATVEYMYGLGKQRILPAALARTNGLDATYVASLTQSAIGAATILIAWLAGWDPITIMFYGLGNAGGLGVFILLALASMAVLRYFWRDPHGEGVWTRLIAPGLAAILLSIGVYLVITNYATLLNVAPGSTAAWAWPASILAPALLGLLRAFYLKFARGQVYAAMVHYVDNRAVRSHRLAPSEGY